jgi:hypothetical protein
VADVLTGETPRKDSTVRRQTRPSKSKRDSADSGEEVVLAIAAKFRCLNFSDVSIIDSPFR